MTPCHAIGLNGSQTTYHFVSSIRQGIGLSPIILNEAPSLGCPRLDHLDQLVSEGVCHITTYKQIHDRHSTTPDSRHMRTHAEHDYDSEGIQITLRQLDLRQPQAVPHVVGRVEITPNNSSSMNWGINACLCMCKQCFKHRISKLLSTARPTCQYTPEVHACRPHAPVPARQARWRL